MGLKRLVSTDEPASLLLVSDESVQAAQQRAARAKLDAELGAAAGDDLVGSLVAAVRGATGQHAEVVAALGALLDVGRGLLGSVLGEGEQAEALARLRGALEQEDTREALAYISSTVALQRYSQSSDLSDLHDPDPDGATWVRVRALSREESRRAREACGIPPRLGADLYGRAGDVSRKASRTGQDASLAFARYIDGLSDDDRREVAKYERWSSDLDRETAALGLVSVDGFEDMTPASGERFPVDAFERSVAGGSAIIAEVAGHIRRVGTLGKAVSLPVSSSPGIDGQDAGPVQAAAGGPARNADGARA